MTAAPVLAATGCAATVRNFEPRQVGWTTIETREDITYEHCWHTLVERLAIEFDLEYVSKDSGYIRTAWDPNHDPVRAEIYRLRSDNDTAQNPYKVRVTVKVAPDGHTIRMKVEALNEWRHGTDTELASTLKQDILGSLGRTTK